VALCLAVTSYQLVEKPVVNLRLAKYRSGFNHVRVKILSTQPPARQAARSFG
jgi:peptidoglycan/LPS O-acetylase OafA/YrhL